MRTNSRRWWGIGFALSGLAALGVLLAAWVGDAAWAADRPVIKVGTVWGPHHSGTLGAKKFAELAMAKSRNAVDIRVLPSSQLGSEREMFEGIRLGSIEMGYIAGNIIQNAEPSAAVPSLPYLITGFDQAFKIEDGPVGQEISARVLKTAGARTLGFFVTGIRHVAAKKPLRSLADFKGLKIRVPESPLFVATFKLLGANPTPIPAGELYTALQTNVVDAAESPPAVLDDFKVFEVARYMILTSHIYASGHILIGEAFWQRLSPEIQKVLLEAAKEAQAYQRKLAVEAQEETVKKVTAKGVSLVPIDTAPLRDAVKSYYQQFARDLGGLDLIDRAIAAR